MTYRELMEHIYSQMQFGEHAMSEQVPDDVAEVIRGASRHMDVLDYLENKIDIKRWVGIGGEKNT